MIIGSSLAGLAGATLLIQDGIFQENLTQSAGLRRRRARLLRRVAAERRDGRRTPVRADGGRRPHLEGPRDHPAQRLGSRRHRAGGDHRSRAPHGRTPLPPAGCTRTSPTIVAHDATGSLRHSAHVRSVSTRIERDPPRHSIQRHADLRVRSRRTRMRTSTKALLALWPWSSRPRSSRFRRRQHRPHARLRRAEGGAHRAERAQRPRVHAVDVRGPSAAEGEVPLQAVRLGEPVRRRGRGERHAPVRSRGLQPHRRPRLPVRRDDPAARAELPQGVVRLGHRELDVQPAERVCVPGQRRTRAATCRATWRRCSARRR